MTIRSADLTYLTNTYQSLVILCHRKIIRVLLLSARIDNRKLIQNVPTTIIRALLLRHSVHFVYEDDNIIPCAWPRRRSLPGFPYAHAVFVRTHDVFDIELRDRAVSQVFFIESYAHTDVHKSIFSDRRLRTPPTSNILPNSREIYQALSKNRN